MNAANDVDKLPLLAGGGGFRTRQNWRSSCDQIIQFLPGFESDYARQSVAELIALFHRFTRLYLPCALSLVCLSINNYSTHMQRCCEIQQRH